MICLDWHFEFWQGGQSVNPSPPGIRLHTPKVSGLQGTNHKSEVCLEPRKIEFHPFWQSAIYGSMAPTIYLIRSQELHRHDQNSRSQQQLSFQVARANLRRWQFTWKCFTGWNVLLDEVFYWVKHLAGEQGSYAQLVTFSLQLLRNGGQWHQYRSCWAWDEMNWLLIHQ